AFARPLHPPSPFSFAPPPRRLPSSPTRRSSDLRLEERADHDLAELTLFFRRNQTAQVEEPRALRPRISAAPHGVPLAVKNNVSRSEEHTSELQSQSNLVCRLLLEKKNKQKRRPR